MANFGVKDIQNLRSMTGAGMMDCKKALVENNGNIDDASSWLREKGLAKALKKSGRTASEGLVAIANNDENNEAVMIELNCETDFVSRNELFQNLVEEVVKIAHKNNKEGASVEDIQNSDMGNGKTIKEYIAEKVGQIGENMHLRRFASVKQDGGYVASYIHSAVTSNSGKIGVIVSLKTSSDKKDEVLAFGKQLAMQIAASSPVAIDQASVPAAEVEKERQILTNQMSDSSKPKDVVEKIVEGRLRKYFEEVVLLEQTYFFDGKSKVKDVIAAQAKIFGDIEVTSFTRFALGEGVEKTEEDE